ncbi:hypothetical protein CHL76_02155 [Marinococcus halophilus]|uniref:Uncharacterized protein n=1 Tax=Marinococcus halophilus TaxID=1371 RepID=A0A510Y1D0_MARHA|nr:hypothetical protein [Marinococcus halophilus]OZT81180.1 hypothetical protein CHL76_02155 [Marinococcus halophilus]GEK57110.1 hypothetical protein MHA01_00150 [Marinococcus halophilus]
MKNNTNIQVPNKYQGMIAEVDFEGKAMGYWAYTEKGFYFPSTGCHTGHEDTQAELLKVIREVKPCNCEECTEEEVLVEEENEEEEETATENVEPKATASVRVAGKKFEYKITLPDGGEATRKSDKSDYRFAVIGYKNPTEKDKDEHWTVFSFHSRKDLAEKSREYNRISFMSNLTIVEIPEIEEMKKANAQKVTFEKKDTVWYASNGMSIRAKFFPTQGYSVRNVDGEEIDFVSEINVAKNIIKQA